MNEEGGPRLHLRRARLRQPRNDRYIANSSSRASACQGGKPRAASAARIDSGGTSTKVIVRPITRSSEEGALLLDTLPEVQKTLHVETRPQ